MSIKIVPYAAEHEEAVRALNARMAAARLDESLYSTHFPTSHIPAWLPKRSGCDLYQEYFVAVDDQSAVRGGYILKHQPFVLNGELQKLAAYQLPISEGISDNAFLRIGVSLYRDALRRQPHLLALGGGAPHVPVVKFLVAAGWQTTVIPFWFRIVHPNAFLQSIKFLRTSLARNAVCDFLKHTGLGWMAIRTIQGIRGKYCHPARVTYETVDEFSDWVDGVWNDCKDSYSLIAVRDRQILNILYPASDLRFKRLKVMRDGKIVGWAVLLNTAMSGHKQFGNMRVGTLVDCLARPDDARDVVACSRDFLEAKGADIIISNQGSQAWCEALKRCGFLSGPSNFPFLASPKLAAQLQPFAENAKTFHLNRGDGDGPIHL